jgi:glycerophosphoryl diester phosphodiesterase
VSKLGRAGLPHRVASILGGWLRPRLPASRQRRPCLVVGHRGAARREPENTLASFRRAVALGADAIETDICVTVDGRFALWHDADPDEKVALARQLGTERLAYCPSVPPVGTPARKPVRLLRAEELLSNYAYVRNELSEIPVAGPERAGVEMLDELLAWTATASAPRHVFLDIKLVEDQTEAAAALVAFLRASRDSKNRTTFHLLSPQAEIVQALLEATRNGEPGFLRVSADFELSGAAEIGPRTGARDVSLGCGGRLWAGFRYDVGRALQARDRGGIESVVAWTINGRPRLEPLVQAGIDGMLTDEPELLRKIVDAATNLERQPVAGFEDGRRVPSAGDGAVKNVNRY